MSKKVSIYFTSLLHTHDKNLKEHTMAQAQICSPNYSELLKLHDFSKLQKFEYVELNVKRTPGTSSKKEKITTIRRKLQEILLGTVSNFYGIEIEIWAEQHLRFMLSGAKENTIFQKILFAVV